MLEIKNKNKIKLIASDFDGVLTDGGLYISGDNDSTFKKINYKDIMGISLWLKNGGKFAIISGDKTNAIDYLKKKFNLEDVYQGLHFSQKNEALAEIMQKYSFLPDEVCYVGDDVNDVAALELAGTAVTPCDSNYKLQEIDDIIISNKKGGSGIIREIVDSILAEL